MQGRISREIVATLAVKLTRFETERSRDVPTSSMAAYQLSPLGRSERRPRTREGNLEARALFAEAIALDPRYADAHVQLGETYLEEATLGWTEWPERSAAKAFELARTAIELGGQSAHSLGFLARVHVRTARFDTAQARLERAFELDPNDLELHEIQGLLHVWNGEAATAIDHLEYVPRYDPGSTLAATHLGTASTSSVGRPRRSRRSSARSRPHRMHPSFTSS